MHIERTVEQQPEVLSIARRIASQAAATPNQVALADDDGELTYEELERESSQLAIRLQRAGAGSRQNIGLFLPRSTSFTVAALAVLKSGAAYVPLDPSTPADRISFILADAGAVAIVTESSIADLVPEGWPVIATDGAYARNETPCTSVDAGGDALAYIIYTSGSTGRPKGVEITHANLCNLVEWHQSAFAVTAKDRGSQVAGLGFDAAGWEIWPYLTAGASVHIADESTRRSAEMLRDWLVAHKVTISFVPTFLAERLFCASWPAETALRLLLTGGDTLERRPPDGLPFAVVNNYGPTECTVVATSALISPMGSGADRPSIGRPIANATALILDDDLRPVPPGEPGELCIGGAPVGRGYRNLPDLTAKQFVTYIAASGEALRIYRTGDRARKLESGEITFLGRVDDQVKIRGYRIELGEITACLNEYPGIESSNVLASNVATGDRVLVAYVVPAANARLSDSAMRRYLAAKLPDYMIPTFFITIDALPLTTNGKIDKSALPAPNASNALPASVGAIDAPRACSAIQQQIHDLVASLLSRSSIEADENFFMAGGHSMFGVQLVAQIREIFGVTLTLRQLFKAPTVAALSAEVARSRELAKPAPA